MSDNEVLRELEKALQTELKEIDNIGTQEPGYLLDHNKMVKGLVLSNLRIKQIDYIINYLKDLHYLSILNLSKNRLDEISSLSELINLKELNLANNQLLNINSLQKLTSLEVLNLEGNDIINFSPINSLPNLRTILVSIYPYCEISSLWNKRIVKMIINGCNVIETQSRVIFNKMESLEELCIYNLMNINFLEGIKKINALDLSNNNLVDISSILKIKGLTKLDLRNNQISNISLSKQFSELLFLNLSHNHIRDISFLKDSVNLTYLDLSSNSISDVTPIKQLIYLKNLDLSNNKIKNLSPLKNLIKKDDLKIVLFENPIETPPIEIARQGIKSIKNFYTQIDEQGKDYIHEAKIMIVGEPGVGKTSLMNKLFNRNYNLKLNESSTVGINVRPNWKFTYEGNKEFKAHIWDFGGQQIQYMLHQFFLTSNCLYILMAEKRKEIANIDYWINIINILGSKSPIIILFNEINLDTLSTLVFNEKKYKDLFPNLDILKMDIDLSKINDGRFDQFINVIKEKLLRLELVGKEVPAKWVGIRQKLELVKFRKHIRVNEYFRICSSFGILNEEDQLLILKYFHLLGIVLHFSDDTNLRDFIFLDPNWTVDAIYSFLNTKKLSENNGKFNKEELDTIWKKNGFDFEERAKLLQLMLKDNFELCYRLPGKGEIYRIPLLLSKTKPEYNWDNTFQFQFRIHYPFMPKGIVSRLIVRLNEYLEHETVWYEGAVFKNNGVRTQVLEKEIFHEGIKILEINSKGDLNQCIEFLAIIREEVKKIRETSFPNLPYYEMIPCNCIECNAANDPYYFSYEDIKKYISKNKPTIECRNSTENILIEGLLGYLNVNKKDKIKNEIDNNMFNTINYTNLSKKGTKIIKIFLASSSELASERVQFEIFINRKNKELISNGLFLELIIWEDFIDVMSKKSLQTEYNNSINNCDIFIMLFFTKVGKFTQNEFRTAFKNFKKTNTPLIYTYFKNAAITTGSINKKEILSMLNFKEVITNLGHFVSEYQNIDDLKYKFNQQLNKYFLQYWNLNVQDIIEYPKDGEKFIIHEKTSSKPNTMPDEV
jgi:internalin A